MYKLGTSEQLWRCREKYPDVFLEPFQKNCLKPLGHATVVCYIEELLSTKDSINILEIGHGSASPTFSIFADNDKVALFGIDDYDVDGTVNNDALDTIRAKNIKFYSGYIDDKSGFLPDAHFDLVYSVSVIEHIPEDSINAFHDELYRILKPGGVQMHSYDRPFGGDVVKMYNTIKESGFNLESDVELDKFWKLTAFQTAGVVFEHPYVVMERFMQGMPFSNRKLYNWVTVLVKAEKP